LKRYNDELLPAWNKDHLNVADANKNMGLAHELLKTDMSNAKLAVEALGSDSKTAWNVFVAENTHRRLVKIGDTANAEVYFKKA